MDVVNLADKFRGFTEAWSPRIVGDLNDMHVKVVKLRGEFVWHHHDTEDELFLVVAGRLRMQLRSGDRDLGPGEFIIVPHGTEHCPLALSDEVHVVPSRAQGHAEHRQRDQRAYRRRAQADLTIRATRPTQPLSGESPRRFRRDPGRGPGGATSGISCAWRKPGRGMGLAEGSGSAIVRADRRAGGRDHGQVSDEEGPHRQATGPGPQSEGGR